MNKKGFTLIELLAVIIILAILMIIAVPNILTTLQTAREQAFKTQAQSIWKAAEQQFIIDSMTGSGFTCYMDTATTENKTAGKASTLNLGSLGSGVHYAVTLNAKGEVTKIEALDTNQKLYVTTSNAGVAQQNLTVTSGSTATAVDSCIAA